MVFLKLGMKDQSVRLCSLVALNFVARLNVLHIKHQVRF